MTLKVLICDERPIMRDGMRTLLEAEVDLAVVEATDSGLHAMMLVRTLHPDVVLTGLALKGISGLDLIRRIDRERTAGSPNVVVIAHDSGDEMVADALNVGVNGLLTRSATREELCSAVRTAAAGKAILAPEIAQMLMDWFRKRTMRPEPVDEKTAGITPRERQVLLLVAQGYSTEGIADELSIGISTVRTHLHRLRTKLAVKDRSQLVSYAYRTGLVHSA